jgi:hypothetical protein
MASDAPQTQSAVRYRPHVWLALAFWAMAPFFGLLAFGDVLTDPTVDINCRRDGARARCEVVTERLLRPSVAPLSDADLRGARVDVVPEPHDRSFKKVELQRGESVRLLAEFSRNAHARAVGEVNAFLDGVSNGPISVRVVGSPHTPWRRLGFFPFQLIGILCVAGGLFSVGRRTTLTVVARELEVRRSRWPWPAVVQRRSLREIAGIEVVSRIPEGLASVVASLPWRNIYRANALVVRTTNGEEVVITDWCRRSRALHDRLAATVRGWLPPAT